MFIYSETLIIPFKSITRLITVPRGLFTGR